MSRNRSHSVSESGRRTGDQTPFIPECEVFYEGGPDSKELYDRCTKNPGHPTFLPVDDVTIDHLPREYRSQTTLKNIKRFCDRTVKIVVNFTSLNRPDTYPNTSSPYPYSQLKGSKRGRCGTGYIEYGVNSLTRGKPCPCPICKKSDTPEMEYLEVKVQTAAHVVFDDSEAECTVCELFYDSDERRDLVRYLYGISGRIGCGGGGDSGSHFSAGARRQDGGGTGAGGGGNGNVCSIDGKDKLEKCTRDKFTIMCVTHEKDLFSVLPKMYNRQEFGRIPTMIVSHPHGRSKHVTFGNILSHTSPLPLDHAINTKYTIGPNVRFMITEKTAYQADELNLSVQNEEASLTSSESDENLSDKAEIASCTSHYSIKNPSDKNKTPPSNGSIENISPTKSLLEPNQLCPTGKDDENATSTSTNMINNASPANEQSKNRSSLLINDSIRFQLLLNNGDLCTPGVEYAIKDKMTLLLPQDAKYFCRCKPCEDGYDPCYEIVRFPPGTKFTYGNQQDCFVLPDDVEFNLESDRERFNLGYFPYHVIYDMDTCPGCSGALIVDENYMDFRLSWFILGLFWMVPVVIGVVAISPCTVWVGAEVKEER